MIFFNNKILPLQLCFSIQFIEEKQYSIEISLIKLENINYKEYMKYLDTKKEEFKLKDEDQNLIKNIENKKDLKKCENFYQE